MVQCERRRFLQIMGLVGLSLSTPAFSWAVPPRTGSKVQTVSQTLPMMNTVVTITVCDTSRERAREAQQDAFARAEHLIPVFDRFDPNSQVSHLNTTGSLTDVPPELSSVLASCSELHRRSHGAFDITILPLLQATKHAVRRTGNPPSPQELKELRTLIGFEHMTQDSSNLRLSRSGMGITLDGIAKGFIVDQAAATLLSHGVDSALINAGGDIRVIGSKAKGPWHIGVQDPTGNKPSLMTLGLENKAIATSGSNENFFDPMARHHHLLNPAAGGSPQRPLSATVIAPSAMQADGLATTLFLLPPSQGIDLAASLPGVQAALVTHGNRLFTTPGFDSLRGRSSARGETEA